jgi:acyl-CoA reductase-like NAD-dependent aldehyde dehydrogenase
MSVVDTEQLLLIGGEWVPASRGGTAEKSQPGRCRSPQRIETGICHINSATVHGEAQMPFGGVKDSGCGRHGGRAAQDEFTELRWITIQETAKHYPI